MFAAGAPIAPASCAAGLPMVATMEAMRDARLEDFGGDKDRCGVCIGSGIGGLPMIEETHVAYQHGGLRKVSPFFIPGSIINMVAGLVSIHYGLRGPNLGTVSACSTGNHSIGEAARLIEYGETQTIFTTPRVQRTLDYVTGRFG